MPTQQQQVEFIRRRFAWWDKRGVPRELAKARVQHQYRAWLARFD